MERNCTTAGERIISSSEVFSSNSQKRMPIIRKPGEVVFPKYIRQATIVQEKESSLQNNTDEDNTSLHRNDGMFPKSMLDSSLLEKLCEQLTRVENKLDQALVRLHHHDVFLNTLKHNVIDLRNEIRNSKKQPAELSTIIDLRDEIQEVTKQQVEIVSVIEEQPMPKPKRQRFLNFPVADDDYLLRIEDSIKTDNDMREELINLFNTAPTTSAYHYMRKNVQNLFINTSRYTWSGKPSHTSDPTQPANPACELQIAEVLVTACIENFPNMSRCTAEKELRRGLQNFNEAIACRARRQEKSLKS